MNPGILEHTGKIDTTKPEILFASLQILLDTFPDMIFVKDKNLTYVAGTKSFANMVGKATMDEVIGRKDSELFEDKELAKHYTDDDKKVFATKQNIIDFIEPLTDENGKPRYSLTSKYLLTDNAGETIGLLGISKDITKEIKAKQQNLQEIQYLLTLTENTHSTILIDITDWKIIEQRLSSTKKTIPLFSSLEHLLQIARTDILGEDTEAHIFFQQFSKEFLENLYSKGQNSLDFKCQFRLADGRIKWLDNELRLMTDPENDHLLLMLTILDIDREKKEEENLIQAATRDQMTNVMNRAASKKEIEKYLTGLGADGVHAAFMIDVDNFKKVNDTYGHQEGDTLLIRLAAGIKSCFRESDIVARFGGDEFFVLAKNMTNRNLIKARAEQLLKVAREAHTSKTLSLSSVSVGISIYPEDGKTLQELYVKADEALYKAKQLGKNQASFSSGE